MGAGASKRSADKGAVAPPPKPALPSLPSLNRASAAVANTRQAVLKQGAALVDPITGYATAAAGQVHSALTTTMQHFLSLSLEQQLESLGQPYERSDEGKSGTVSKCFHVIPQDEEFKKRNPTIIMEVSSVGFRLLRPETEAPMGLYSWGQVHSWAHAPSEFAFRHFDESKGTILRHSFAARDVDEILAQIQAVIDGILSERKRLAISSEGFTSVMRKLEATDPAQRVDVLAAAVKDNYFFSAQGTEVMKMLPTTFEKVDVAVLLHGRLVDQTAFSKMLEDADCQGDKDNIWHRITALRKANTIARGERGEKRNT